MSEPARKLIYSMGPSLDGFIADRDGDFSWGVPDEEQHRFHNREVEDVGIHLCGRRLYEVMSYWDTEEAITTGLPYEVEFARIWQDTPKLVFSTMLEEVGPNAELAQGDVVEVVEELKREPGKDLAVGGATLAAPLIEAGLVDEYRLFVSPAIAGGGTPFFPPLDRRLELELVETRTFASRVVYSRYSAAVVAK